MQPIEQLDTRSTDQTLLDEAIAQFRQAFQAAAQAMARTASPPPAPRQPHLNRHERRRLAAMTRKP
jgi:hypothetical protein